MCFNVFASLDIVSRGYNVELAPKSKNMSGAWVCDRTHNTTELV